jgi:sporulation protein YlmC with PRC-barrel domain
MALANPHAKGNYIVALKKSLIGSKVVNAARENLGKIEDVVIDCRDNQIAYAILSFGGVLGLGDKHFAIPWETITYIPSDQCAIVNIEKDRLANAPGFDKHNWPDLSDGAWANKVHTYYGCGPEPRP